MMHAIRSPAAAAGRWLRSVGPERSSLRADIVAGLPGAISSVPDGMAAAVLAGVNPVQGLYASFSGRIAGGLSSNTRMMVITTTSADYGDRLAGSGGRLYLSGLEPSLIEQLRSTGHVEGPVRSFEATPVIGESTQAAYLDAEAWLVKGRGG